MPGVPENRPEGYLRPGGAEPGPGGPFFAHCNSITRTVQLAGEKTSKQVYVFYKGDTLCLSGRRGLPRWPGVLPALVLRA
ncbi:MAG: hypothetical protein FJY95_21820 [Candidatus Handelsmanbacteria bacterium]|nr:hypothetical protein [Candidatus Handelsmanbacteria bacterium]